MSLDNDLELLAARRWRVAVSLTAVMLVAYFGFILLIAFDKPLVGKLVFGGSVSVGVVLGALVIALAPILTGIYVRWANLHYDGAAAALGVRRDDAHDAAQAAKGAITAPASTAAPAFPRARTPLPIAAGDASAVPPTTSSSSEVRS